MRVIRAFFVIVLWTATMSTVSGQEWQRYLLSPETAGLNMLATSPDQTIVGVGNDGVVRFFQRTDSITLTQTAMTLWPQQQDLFDVEYIEGAFYAVGRKGSLVRIEGNEIATLPDPTQRERDIRLLEHLNGVTLIGGATAPFQRSTDGLLTWQEIELPIKDSIADMCTDGRSRWYVITQRRLWTSSDGLEFAEIAVPDSAPLVRIQARTNDAGITTLWCVANNGTVHISRNNGMSWSTVPFVPNVVRPSMPWATVYAFEVSPDGTVLVFSGVAGPYSLFVVSDDGGETWVDQNLVNFALIDASPAIVLDTNSIGVIKRGAPALAVKRQVIQDNTKRIQWTADNVTGLGNQFTRISFSRGDTVFALTNNGVETMPLPNPTRNIIVPRSRYDYRTITAVDHEFILTMDSSYTVMDGDQIVAGVNTLFLRTNNGEASVGFVDTVRGGTTSVARSMNTIIAAKMGPTILTADVALSDTIYRPLPGYLSRGVVAAAPDGSSVLLYAIRAGEHHLLRSTDEGRTWAPTTTFLGAITTIEYVGTNLVFVGAITSDNPRQTLLYRSSDAGKSFEQPELSFPQTSRTPIISGNGSIIVVVVDTTIITSVNGGFSWSTIRMPRVRNRAIQPRSVTVTPRYFVLGTDVDLHYAPTQTFVSTQETRESSSQLPTLATQGTFRIPHSTGKSELRLRDIHGRSVLVPIIHIEDGMAEGSVTALPNGLYTTEVGQIILKY